MNVNAANFNPTQRQGSSGWTPDRNEQRKTSSYMNMKSYEQYSAYEENMNKMDINAGSERLINPQYNHESNTPVHMYYDTGIHDHASMQISYTNSALTPNTHAFNHPYGLATMAQSYYEEFRFFSPLQNAPIAKINLDNNHEELIYVSSHAIHEKDKYNNNNSHKTNRISYLATHHLNDGEIYSAVAAHPDPNSLIAENDDAPKYLNSSLGLRASKIGSSSSSSSNHLSRNNDSTFLSTMHKSLRYNTKHYQPPDHFGIGSLFHFPTMYMPENSNNNNTKESIIGSISSYGIRLHSQGGLLLAEFPFALASSSSRKEYNQSSTRNTVKFVPWKTCCGCLHSTPNYASSQVSAAGTSSSTHQGQSKQLPPTRPSSIYTYDFNRGTCTSIHQIESGVHDIKASSWNQTLVAGCEDGFIRFFDTRILGKQQKIINDSVRVGIGRGGLATVAQVSGQEGGIAQLALSPNGTTFCCTGYYPSSRNSFVGSRHMGGSGVGESSGGQSSPLLYASQQVLEFDTRFLGRGGISHTFQMDPMVGSPAGDPRFVDFLPDLPRTLLLASGQVNNGIMKIMNLDENSDENEDKSMFVDALLENGERIMDLQLDKKGDIWVGTSFGRVSKFRRNKEVWGKDDDEGVQTSGGKGISNCNETEQNTSLLPELTKTSNAYIERPPFIPPSPPISIDPKSIQKNLDDNTPFFNPFRHYTMLAIPQITCIDENVMPSLHSDPLINRKMIATPRRSLLPTLQSHLEEKNDEDFVASVSATSLGLKLMEPNSYSEYYSNNEKKNPNKLLYTKSITSKCYDLYADPRKVQYNSEDIDSSKEGTSSKAAHHSNSSQLKENKQERSTTEIPAFYRRTVQPPANHKYNYTQLNTTNIWPGWDDEGGNMPNAYAAPLIAILFFTPEVRNTLLKKQFDQNLWHKYEHGSLSVELGFLFHQIYQRSIHALTHPDQPQVGAFNPSSFLSTLAFLPEASNLALLDGSGTPEAKEYLPRRLEAFWRFLLHHLDREIFACRQKTFGTKLMDSIHGMDFMNVNEFIIGPSPPTAMNTRSLTVELCYDVFVSKNPQRPTCSRKPPSFGKILLHSLCKETRLRAWSKETKKFATVVQRKIAISLSKVMAITCVGKKGENEDAMKLWREGGVGYVPEEIEVEIKQNEGGYYVVLKEFINGQWHIHEGLRRSNIQSENETKVNDSVVQRRKYKLVSVVSYVRPPGLSNADKDSKLSTENDGYHLVHISVPKQFKKEILSQQKAKAESSATKSRMMESCMSKIQQSEHPRSEILPPLTRASQISSSDLDDRARNYEKMQPSNEWVLMNGIVVTKTDIDAVCDFSLEFRDPCLIVYRDEKDMADWDNYDSDDFTEATMIKKSKKMSIPSSVMDTPSLSRIPQQQTSFKSLPGAGDIVAIDAEFVLVQHEESEINANGSKLTTKEGRRALARVSVIDCRSDEAIIDDYVLSHEPVVDYLTRFSGIHPSDLDPISSPHSLVTMRTAYLKLRLLLDRGCIFLGHGLDQDFRMLNIFVPPSQIIDTVTIFRQKRSRMISLRFLANYLLGRDMQQDTHDSIEDARAALEIYRKAIELKVSGQFDSVLSEIYEYGQQNDWKLGGDA